MNGSFCGWLKDTGRTRPCTLPSDTQAGSCGITAPLLGQVSGLKYSFVKIPVSSLPVMRNTIYYQATIKQKATWMKMVAHFLICMDLDGLKVRELH
jgi:hypothetical protein